MPRSVRFACTLLLATAAMGAAQAADSVYMCVDAKGRRLTADRPIPECADRDQKVFNRSGTVRGVLPPTPTASERAAVEARERKAAEEQQRLAEQKRVQKLLVARYPNQAAHDADRAKALQAVQDAITSGQKRIGELVAERRKLDEEAEFYKTPQQWPPKLKRQFEDNEHQAAAQQRFIAAQIEERKRIAAKFDEELARLKALWTQNQTAAMPASAVQR